MKKRLFAVLILSAVMFNAAFADDFSDAVVKAKKDLASAYDKNDRNGILKARGEFERIFQLKKNQWLIDYYLAYSDLLMSYTYIQEQDKDNLKKYTESCIDMINKCTDLKDDFSEAYILRMAVESNRWMYEPDKMNDIIARLGEASDRAKKLEPDNPRFYLVTGMNTYYTPASFGGGADNALPLLQKSYDLFQTRKEKDETYPDWGYESCLGMLALCMIDQNKMDDAKKYMDKALELYPESGFINGYVKKQYDEKVKK